MPDIYMSIPGIPGEVTASGHAGKISLESCGWSFERLIDPTTGVLSSPVLPRLIRVNKLTDRSSPLLAQSASAGAALSSCDIQCFRPVGGSPVLIWRLLLSNCRVEGFYQAMNPGAESRPTEEVVFSYGSLQLDIGGLTGSNRYTFKA